MRLFAIGLMALIVGPCLSACSSYRVETDGGVARQGFGFKSSWEIFIGNQVDEQGKAVAESAVQDGWTAYDGELAEGPRSLPAGSGDAP